MFIGKTLNEIKGYVVKKASRPSLPYLNRSDNFKSSL